MRLLLIFKNKNQDRCYARELKERLKKVAPGVNDVRIDEQHIEVDLFCDDSGCINLIESYINERLIESIDLSQKVNEDFKLYLKSGRFWEAHESLEEKWKVESDQKRKNSLRAAIQFCAAMVHYQRCNDETSKEILKRALTINSDENFVKYIIGIDINKINRSDPNPESISKLMMQ